MSFGSIDKELIVKLEKVLIEEFLKILSGLMQ